MHRRSLPACIAIVLAAHGAAAWGILQPKVSGDGMQAVRAPATVQLIAVRASPIPAQAPAFPAAANTAIVTRAPPAAQRAAPSPTVRSTAPVKVFRSPEELERAAVPRSAPDTTLLADLPWSGLPMRLRLFVDATGTVVDVTVLQSGDDDEVVQRVRRMFLSTGFIAARAGGEDVASYKDVEIAIGDVEPHGRP